MLKSILIFVAFVAVLLLAVGFLLPTRYEVERSIIVQAYREDVHDLVADLEQWERWAPWKEEDPTLRTTLGDTTRGVGASQSWTGDSGGGRLHITASDPDTGIAYEMVFLDGERELPASGRIGYTDKTGATVVTWSMSGDFDMPVVGGWYALFADRMIGPMFERGLEKLKVAAES